tara:strand:- start:9100 stop:9786 length:687 start_codon:yes stop_codon:yes gene_type:complete
LKDKKRLDLNDYELFVFDCDGVLLDSNKLKSKAFRITLENYPKSLVDSFISYHELSGGISRYVKLEYFLSNILKKKNYQEEHQDLLNRFSIISMDLISKNSKLVPGVKDLLRKLKKEKKYSIVCSGADEIDLKKILALKNLDHYFSAIYGSPKTKKEILLKVCSESQNTKMRGIFFGDAASDYEAAKKYAFDFIFVSYNSDWKNANEISSFDNLTSIHSFRDIKVLIS